MEPLKYRAQFDRSELGVPFILDQNLFENIIIIIVIVIIIIIIYYITIVLILMIT